MIGDSVSGLVFVRNVPSHVEREVIRTGKGTLAHLATERLHSRVLAVVAGEFVGAGESPLATLPVANVWLLAGV